MPVVRRHSFRKFLESPNSAHLEGQEAAIGVGALGERWVVPGSFRVDVQWVESAVRVEGEEYRQKHETDRRGRIETTAQKLVYTVTEAEQQKRQDYHVVAWEDDGVPGRGGKGHHEQ